MLLEFGQWEGVTQRPSHDHDSHSTTQHGSQGIDRKHIVVGAIHLSRTSATGGVSHPKNSQEK